MDLDRPTHPFSFLKLSEHTAYHGDSVNETVGSEPLCPLPRDKYTRENDSAGPTDNNNNSSVHRGNQIQKRAT